MTHITLERGVAFFEDGTEVSNVDVDLVKAAPFMLKALKDALCEYTLHGSLTDSKRIMRDAIAKAEGK